MRSSSPEADRKPEEMTVLEMNGGKNFRKNEWQLSNTAKKSSKKKTEMYPLD